MRKQNDGYVLPFVLVVLVVVSFVAVSLMSSALTNLQRQQASVQRMEDKYAALGEIAEIAFQIESYSGSANGTCKAGTADVAKTQANTKVNEAEVKEAALKKLVETLSAMDNVESVQPDVNPMIVYIKDGLEQVSVQVVAKYEITYEITTSVGVPQEVGTEFECSYQAAATVTEATCTSYEISTEVTP